MNLPEGIVRNSWWVVLTAVLSAFLFLRWGELATGDTTPIDGLALIAWLALVLTPLFKEVNLLGLSVKSEIADLKAEVKSDLAEFRSDIRNAVDVRTHFNPTFHLPGYPPPDSHFNEVEKRVKQVLDAELRARGIRPDEAEDQQLVVGEEVLELFRARYNIEKELRRLWEGLGDIDPMDYRRRYMPASRITVELAKAEVIDSELARAAREVYSATSTAIHGEKVSEKQLKFVRDLAPELIAALRDTEYGT